MPDKWRGVARSADGRVTETIRATPGECLSALADSLPVLRVARGLEQSTGPFDDVLVLAFVHMRETDHPMLGAELAPASDRANDAALAVLRELERT